MSKLEAVLKGLSPQIVFFVSIGALIALTWLLGDTGVRALQLDPEGIEQAEFWRLLTGHLVHTNLWHLLLNIASLTLIAMLFSALLSVKEWGVVFIASALLISCAYLLLSPDFDHYVGLSAVLYAVIIVGACFDIKTHPVIATTVLVIVTGRVIWQQYSGAVDELAHLINARVAIESHLYGVITGYLLAGMLFIVRLKTTR